VFDSPFEFCTVCGEYVLLDQTQRQCAREHGCAPATQCPLHRYFTGMEFGRDGDAAMRPGKAKRSRTVN
jgi:hypothetical protein